jgi:hypothetical protein
MLVVLRTPALPAVESGLPGWFGIGLGLESIIAFSVGITRVMGLAWSRVYFCRGCVVARSVWERTLVAGGLHDMTCEWLGVECSAVLGRTGLRIAWMK